MFLSESVLSLRWVSWVSQVFELEHGGYRGIFPVLIGLGIDYAIQFHARFDEESRKGTLDDAVMTTVTKTGPAVMYAMLATSIGFLAMFISPVPMIRSFGLVAIIGVMTCYCVSLLGMPNSCRILNYKPKKEEPEVCYAVGEGACDDLPVKSRTYASGFNEGWSYAKFLTDTSVKIAKNPVPGPAYCRTYCSDRFPA